MRYEDLEVYKSAFAFALDVHELTREFPAFEQFELARQLRRSSKSTVSNLVEGTSRIAMSGREQQRFLTSAIGSNDETKLWISMCRKLGYISESRSTSLMNDLERIRKQLFGLWRRNNSSQPKTNT